MFTSSPCYPLWKSGQHNLLPLHLISLLLAPILLNRHYFYPNLYVKDKQQIHLPRSSIAQKKINVYTIRGINYCWNKFVQMQKEQILHNLFLRFWRADWKYFGIYFCVRPEHVEFIFAITVFEDYRKKHKQRNEIEMMYILYLASSKKILHHYFEGLWQVLPVADTAVADKIIKIKD